MSCSMALSVTFNRSARISWDYPTQIRNLEDNEVDEDLSPKHISPSEIPTANLMAVGATPRSIHQLSSCLNSCSTRLTAQQLIEKARLDMQWSSFASWYLLQNLTPFTCMVSFRCVVACVATVCWCYWSSSQRGHSNAGWRGSRDAAISTMLQMVDKKEGIANFTLIDTGKGRLYHQTAVLQNILLHIQPAGGMDFRFRPAPPHPKLSSPQIFPQIGTVGSLQINQTT